MVRELEMDIPYQQDVSISRERPRGLERLVLILELVPRMLAMVGVM